jgi:hypothetical protein
MGLYARGKKKERKRTEKGKKSAILSIARRQLPGSWGEVEGLPSSGLVLLHHIFPRIRALFSFRRRV